MVEENQAPLTIQRTWKEFTSLQLFYIGQMAVFDTAFHQTIPVIAHKYAIPNKFLTEQH
jgi:acetate kinase